MARDSRRPVAEDAPAGQARRQSLAKAQGGRGPRRGDCAGALIQCTAPRSSPHRNRPLTKI